MKKLKIVASHIYHYQSLSYKTWHVFGCFIHKKCTSRCIYNNWLPIYAERQSNSQGIKQFLKKPLYFVIKAIGEMGACRNSAHHSMSF